MTLDYPKICSNLLGGLPERTKDVLVRRFGLAPENSEKETLEAIGAKYGLTRERVRQIEEDGMARLRKAETSKTTKPAFDYFQSQLKNQGGLKREDLLLSELGKEKFNSCVLFLLTVGEPFSRYGETKEFYPFWTTKPETLSLSQKIVNHFIEEFKKESKPLPAKEFFQIQTKKIKNKLGKQVGLEVLVSSYEIAKKIEENPFGEIGLIDWPEIKPRGIKDKAYIIFKKEGKPLHFVELTEKINQMGIDSETKALSQTVHNELIKDPRFILVGRGTYGLAEWGFKPGWVRDVIIDVLKEAKKPLAKDEIVKKVMVQRLVKPNTILLNLSNRDYFVRNKEGKYTFKK